ncbi:tetratricopeptide repeat protein [Paenibacillus sp. J5C_2022]|uniref:tetratricopeptide repeat protein n=1 Tax=Paenibacillus sp. J5C2022 TaxID=2977129 RepID=UPI0021D07CB7|nr:tetratricopeptide repeat protein [Paenibacillus sp. J5C2022]MCU6708329.1 tetratricopeptide repeat protein [Paenibacillus sp. J5C2022]
MDGASSVKKAYELILQNDFEGAIYWFEQAIAADPGNASYYHRCAVSCARSEKWQQAKVYADTAEQMEPDNEEYRYHARVVQAKLLIIEVNHLLATEPPSWKDAEDLLMQAISLDPICFEGYYTLALVYGELGRLDEAAANAREALRLEPQHAAARRLFADLNRKRRMQRNRTINRRK